MVGTGIVTMETVHSLSLNLVIRWDYDFWIGFLGCITLDGDLRFAKTRVAQVLRDGAMSCKVRAV